MLGLSYRVVKKRAITFVPKPPSNAFAMKDVPATACRCQYSDSSNSYLLATMACLTFHALALLEANAKEFSI
jgi:hypothetical protein